MKQISTFLFVSMIALTSLAAQLPDHYPSEIGYAGVVDNIDLRNQVITVNGRKFALSTSTIIHTLNRPYNTAQSIKSGDKIGYRFEKNGKRKHMLVEIWLLPRDYSIAKG